MNQSLQILARNAESIYTDKEIQKSWEYGCMRLVIGQLTGNFILSIPLGLNCRHDYMFVFSGAHLPEQNRQSQHFALFIYNSFINRFNFLLAYTHEVLFI